MVSYNYEDMKQASLWRWTFAQN